MAEVTSTKERETTTRERVARKVRIAAREKYGDRGAKTALRDALGLVDWRNIKSRWDGHVDYTVPQLAIVADALGVPLAELTAGAGPDEEHTDE